ncbi:MAG: SpaA isopeptide-forming pilin-related protein [Clostridia bacterium]|nr:SpaA isopeptide-forming pilin-related protein [Clostridia bacterium]
MNIVRAEPVPPDVRLGNLVWLDVDGSGVQGAGKPGIQGVTVTLHDYVLRQAGADWTPTLVSSTSVNTAAAAATVLPPAGDNGALQNYLFTAKPYKTTAAGAPFNNSQHWYELELDLPGGYALSPRMQGADRSLDSNALRLTGAAGGYFVLPDSYSAATADSRYISFPLSSPTFGDDLTFDAGIFPSYDVQLKKVDAQGNPLGGAVFELFVANGAGVAQGSAIATATSNAAGAFSFTGLNRFVHYAVKERTAPAYYQADARSLHLPAATLPGGGDNITLAALDGLIDAHALAISAALAGGNDTFKNEAASGSLTIHKKNAKGEALAGAVFEITNTSTFIAGAWDAFLNTAMPAGAVADRTARKITVTMPSGAYTLPGLPYGAYQVTEVRAPVGYALPDPAAFTVRIGDPDHPSMPGHVKAAALEVTDPKITLTVKKVNGEDRPLAGAEFAVYRKADYDANPATAAVLFALATGANGLASMPETHLLAPGDYYLVETKAPGGYSLITDKFAFSVTAAQTEYVIHFTGEDQTPGGKYDIGHPAIVNTSALGAMRINKFVSGTNTRVGGAQFLVMPGTLVVTGAWGLYLADLRANLPLPAGLQIVGDNDPNGYPTDSLLVTLPAAGAGLGTIDITGLPVGTYQVREVAAPLGYALPLADTKTVTVTVTEPGHAFDAVDFEDMRVVLSIEKFDITGNTALSGARFGIFTKAVYDQGAAARIEANAAHVLITGSDGRASTVNLLAPGDYVLVELAPPANYAITFADTPFTVSNRSTVYSYNFTKTAMAGADAASLEVYFGHITNRYTTGGLTIDKKDAEGRNPQTGAEFIIRNKSTLAAPGAWAHFVAGFADTANVTKETENGASVLRAVIPASGTVTIGGLPAGVYEVEEVKAPSGFAIAKPAKGEVTVTASGAPVLYTVINQRVRVDIRKVDGNGQNLADVVFAIHRDVAGAMGAELYELAPTDGQGRAVTTAAQLLAPGAYWLREKSAPAGYTISFEPVRFTVSDTSLRYYYNFTGTPHADGEVEQPFPGPIANSFTAGGGLTIVKQDAETGTRLGGAAFTVAMTSEVASGSWVSYISGAFPANVQRVGQTLRVTLDNTGAFTFEDIPLGTYTVTEVQAPIGYAVTVNDVRTGVAVNEEGVSLTFSNYRRRVEIEKTELGESAKPIAGVKFGIFTEAVYNQGAADRVEANALYVLTTGADGKAATAAGQILDTGAYWLVELEAPANYRITFANRRFEVLASSKVVSFNFTGTRRTPPAEEQYFGKITNDYARGSLRIEKVSAADTSVFLPGAEFTVKPVSLAAGAEAWAYFLDTAALPAHVSVVTEAGQRWLRVVHGSAMSVTTLEGLPIGAYEITETKAPNGYAVAYPASQSAAVAAGVATAVQFRNEYVRVEIEKLDATGQNPVQGAVFGIFAKAVYDLGVLNAATAKYTLTTAANGKAATTSGQLLEPGDYVLVELSAPAGYRISFAPQAFAVSNTTPLYSYNFTATAMNHEDADVLEQYYGAIRNDTATGALKIEKVDAADPARFLTGAEFTVRNVRTAAAEGAWEHFIGGYTPPAGVSIGTESGRSVLRVALGATSGGTITLTGLPTGEYAVTEETAPEGYAVAYPRTQNIAVTVSVSGSANTVQFRNERVRVEIEKVDEAGSPLAGVVFAIYRDNGGAVGGLLYTLAPTGLSGKTGTTESQVLVPGDYWLVELAVPTGYQITFADTKFTVDRTGQVFSYNFTGSARSVAEVEAFYGAIENEFQRSSITIVKRDAETSALLEGAEFILSNTSTVAPGAWDDYLDKLPAITGVSEETRGASRVLRIALGAGSGGTITLNGLPLGVYQVTEALAPVGYAVASPASQTADIVSGSATLTFNNLRARVQIEKLRQDGTGLPGAVFGIFTETAYAAGALNAATAEYVLTTGADGKASTEAGQPLEPGAYWLVELSAPAGYRITFADTKFTVDRASAVFSYNFTAAPRTGIDPSQEEHFGAITNDFIVNQGGLVIEKRDADTNAPLAGAEFTVRQITPVAEGLFGWHHFLDNLDMAANPDVTVATEGAARVLRVVTPAGGPVAVKGMPIGLYEVEETRAPNGYALPLDSVRRITLTETTTPITVTFLDPRARLSLEKVNPEGQAIEGAVFEIRRETQNGDVAYTLTTGASGLAQTLPGQLLSEGTYWLVETFAPVGYTISFAPAWFEVGRESTMFSFNFTATQTPGLSDAQEDHRGAITNEYTQGSLVLRNEDAETGDRLDGGRFIVRNVRTAPGAWQRYLRELDPSNPYLSVETIGGENVLVVIIPPGSNGEIVIPGLPIGDYAVQENKASPGYAIGDIAPKPVTLQDGATDAPVLIFPDNLVRVRLHKLDANGLDLAGVTFGVFTDAAHQNGEPALYTLTTGADGRAATTRHELIDEGDYWLVELSAPVGYAITFPPRAFTVDRTGTVYLYTHTDQTTPPADPAIEERRPAIPNAFATTTLTISKFNEGTQLLEGAEFVLTFVNSVAPGAWEYFAGRFTDTAEVRLWSAAGASGLHITLSDGKDTLYGLPWGEYTLQEVKAPVGYAILDNSVRAVRLGDPAKTDNRYALDDTQDFRDAHLRVRVEKRDEAGNRLAQARFAIFTDAYYRANSASLNIAQAVATLTTDGSGFAETTEPDAGKLVPGTYWLVETAAPPFHDLTFRPVSFAVTREQTKYVYNFTSTAHAEDVAGFEGKPSAAVMNPISTGELLITVSDAETGAPLTGATFRVTASHTLVPGAWDYFLSTLAAAPQPGVTVKLSAKTLTLRLDSPATTFHLTDIPWGEFVVTEISAPSGYALSDPEPIKTAKVGDPAQAGDSGYALTQRAHFVNLRIRLRLEKINEEGQPLPGAQFVINDAAGRLVHTLAPTDANGFTETGLTQLLPPGSYNLVETKAPAGYFIYPDPIPFTVTDTQTRWVFNLTGSPVTGQVPGVFVNIDVPLVDPYGHGALTLEKADAQAPDTPSLAGAVFELTNVSTIVPGRWAAFLLELATRPQPNVTVAAGGKVLVTTAAGGRGLVNRLPWGEYTVREIQAPLGYVISDPAPRTLYLGDAQDALVMATGRPYRQDVTARFLDERIRVQITKINQFGNVLPGVTFLLQNISDPSNPVTVETLRTDSEGFTQSRTLLGPGMYRLTELSTVLYHTITFGGYDFLVGPAQTQAVYDFTYARNPNFAADNGPIVNQAESGTVRVSKIDSVSGTNLRGATFRLRQISARTDAMRISTPRVVSTNASGIAIFADVPYGYYELTETRAPGGYAATTVTQYVTVGRAQRDVTYTFTNGRIIGSVRVYKYEVDENGVEVPLAGAQFTLTGNSRFGDRVNLTGTSDASGYIIYNNVPAGTYRLTETRAPSEEYSVAPPRNVVVDRQGASVLVPVLNRKIGMTGQVLGVEDPDGPNIRGGEELPILNYVGGGALIVAMGLLLLFAQRRRMRAG